MAFSMAAAAGDDRAALSLIPRQLNDAARLCGDAGEAQVMSDQVRRRLESLAAAVRVAHLDANLAAACESAGPELALADVVRRFVAFLTRAAHRDVVYRLASSRVVVAHVRGFHKELDRLLAQHAAALPLEAQSDVHAWQDRFENARENVWLTLDEISRDRMALLRDLLDSQAQHDALTLIIYEYKRPAGTYTPAERQVVQNAFNTITRFSRAKAPVLPIWFLPLYDVAFEAQAARESAAVEVRRGAIGDAPVAVKIVRANVAETLEAFMHAVSAWFSAGRASPHVVRLHGASHVGEVSYVVEDAAGDRSLRDFMAREPQRLWGALHGAAQGLEVLHRQGVVHGRLETGGVVVAADGTAKITDNILSSLGLLEPAGSDDSVGMIENASGLGGAHPEPTVASDVLAFGACIMNTLGGSEADPLSSGSDAVTVEQWGLLQRMCSERPDDRPVLADVVAQFGAFAEAERTPREAAEPAAWKEEPRREPAAASDAANQPEKASRQQLKEAEAEAAEPSQLEAVESAAPKEEARRESALASAVTNQPEKPSRQQVKEARKREKEAKRQERKARKSAKQDTDRTHCIVQ